MIYLDYSATTPVLDEVLDSYVRVTRDFIGNANSIHTLGVKSKELLMKASKQISEILGCERDEVIFTSGASESNSAALKGVAFRFAKRGRHIISTPLEHKSVKEVLNYLESIGFSVSYVKLTRDGQVDLKNLESLVRDDTILVSVCAVNSEVGYKAPLKTIRQVVHKKNKNVIIHSDMTQALGKCKVNVNDVDLASFSGHKIYAPKGIGILYKSKKIDIEPLVWGLTENAKYRGGTPALPLIVSLAKAMRIMNENFEEDIKYVSKLNKILVDGLAKFDLHVNSNSLCVPHIVNVSLKKIKSETFVRAIEREGVYISTQSACSSLDEGSVLKYVTDDVEVNSTSVRISLSHLTSKLEVNEFLRIFYKTYDELLLKK